jgi:hypothetical protein
VAWCVSRAWGRMSCFAAQTRHARTAPTSSSQNAPSLCRHRAQACQPGCVLHARARTCPIPAHVLGLVTVRAAKPALLAAFGDGHMLWKGRASRADGTVAEVGLVLPVRRTPNDLKVQRRIHADKLRVRSYPASPSPALSLRMPPLAPSAILPDLVASSRACEPLLSRQDHSSTVRSVTRGICSGRIRSSWMAQWLDGMRLCMAALTCSSTGRPGR